MEAPPVPVPISSVFEKQKIDADSAKSMPILIE